jgi:hypothetical protein
MPRSFLAGGTGDDLRSGIERAVALGWLWLHESGTYLKFTGRSCLHDLVFSKSLCVQRLSPM